MGRYTNGSTVIPADCCTQVRLFYNQDAQYVLLCLVLIKLYVMSLKWFQSRYLKSWYFLWSRDEIDADAASKFFVTKNHFVPAIF